jgi:hypothetical protein
MNKLLTLLITLFSTIQVLSQTYELVLKNDVQTASNEYEFDIYIRPKAPTTTFELASLQCVMTFNTGIGSGLSFSIVTSSSQLNSVQQPNSSSISGGELIVPARTPPGSGSGTVINNELKVARFKLTNNLAFNPQSANINWKNSVDPFTKVNAYVSSVNTSITNSTNHLNQLSYQPLPIELVAFTAATNQNIVNLKWQTKTEVNNYGFEVERSLTPTPSQMEGAVNWTKIGFVNGNGNSNSAKEYSFTDKNPTGGSKFIYRLKQIDSDGKFEYSQEVEVELAPQVFNLYQNYPNPFNPSTTIRFALPVATKLNIVLYNSLGESLRTIAEGFFDSGYHSVEIDLSGLPSGVYIYRFNSDKYANNKKLLLLK